MSISINTDFPGGNIVFHGFDSNTVLIEPDQKDNVNYWFYWCFDISGAAGRHLTFKFLNTNEVGALTKMGPAFSYDGGRTWEWLCPDGANRNYDSFAFEFPDDAHTVRFALSMAYTQNNLEYFLAGLESAHFIRREVLCASRKGREVECLKIGREGDCRTKLLITCRHHACEMIASYAVEGILKYLVSTDSGAAWLQKNAEVIVIPFVDKDGVEDGNQGKFSNPHDHNRDYGTECMYPEVRAIRAMADEWSGCRLFALDLHCPWIRDKWNEHIYLVGSQQEYNWDAQCHFSEILESVHDGKLPYSASGNLPFNTEWNVNIEPKGRELDMPERSSMNWAATIPGVDTLCAGTFEIPYAKIGDKAVYANDVRIFGNSLGLSIHRFLSKTSF